MRGVTFIRKRYLAENFGEGRFVRILYRAEKISGGPDPILRSNPRTS